MRLKNLLDRSNCTFFVITAGVILFFQLLPGPRPVDDAYITFRYAKNLANGLGFVYNVGEPVLGTTTPLYTLWLALVSILTRSQNFPWIALLTNAIFDFATIVFFRQLWLALKMENLSASLIAMTYLLNPIRIGVSVGGMETSVTVFWIVATFYTYIVLKKDLWAAAMCGVAFLTRPDTILLSGILVGITILLYRRLPIKEGIVFVSVITPWMIFSWLQFGNPIPHSILAKSQAYVVHPLHAPATLLGYLANRAPLSHLNWPLSILGFSLGMGLFFYLIGTVRSFSENARTITFSIFPFLYVTGLIIAHPLLFIWYFPPFTIFLDGLIFVGVMTIFRHTTPRIKPVINFLVWMTLLIVEWNGITANIHGWSVHFRDREDVYAQVATILKDKIIPEETIAASEVGVLGYEFPSNMIIDTVGLISPEAVPYLLKAPLPDQPTNYAISNEVIEALQPDYIISLEIFTRVTLLKSADFLESYQLVEVVNTNAFESEGLLVHKKLADD